MKFVRVRLSRTGGSPSSQFPAIRPINGGSGTAVAAGAVQAQAFIRLVSRSQSVTEISLKTNSIGISSSQDGAQPFSLLSEDFQWVTVSRNNISAGNGRLDMAITLSGATVDFEVVLDIGLIDFVQVTNDNWITSVFDNSAAGRAVSTVRINVPDGTYDRYIVTANQGASLIPAWADDLVISGGTGDILPAVSRNTTLEKVLYFPAGLISQEKDAVIDYENPVIWGANTGYVTQSISGDNYLPHCANKPYSILRAANRSNLYRFELRENEFPPAVDGATGSGKDRCELYSTSRNWIHGNEYWVAFRLNFINLPDIVSNGYFIFLQLHDTYDSGFDTVSPPPPLEIGLAAGTRKLKINIAGSTSNPLSSYGQITMAEIYRGTEDMEADRGYEFVIAAKEGYDGTGRLRTWVDGQQICDYQGGMGYNNAAGSYIKYGLYRSRHNTAVASEVANFIVSPTSLESRIANPLPVA